MSTQNTLDLRKVEAVVLDNIDLLLSELNLDYTEYSGSVFMCCPIHGSDNDKSLSISLDKRCWACWSHECHSDLGTSIFDFVSGVLECDFSGALSFLLSLYNLDGGHIQTEHIERTDLHDIVKIFGKRVERGNPPPVIWPNTIGKSEYFEDERGFKHDTLREYGVEDCWNGSKYHRRAIIPIHDEEGNKVAFIARRLKEFMEPKYIYSDGFSKSKYLYNYHKAIEHVERNIYITEGQGDIWRLNEAGIHNCVGILGKSISPYQKGLLLSSGATTLTVLVDNDQPGREAKQNILRDLNRMFRLVFPKMDKKDIGDMSIDKVRELLL